MKSRVIVRKPPARNASGLGSTHRDAEAGLERIMHLEEQLARAPVNSRQRRDLTRAIRIEAGAYRKFLDTAQLTASHDPHRPTVRPQRKAARLD